MTNNFLVVEERLAFLLVKKVRNGANDALKAEIM